METRHLSKTVLSLIVCALASVPLSAQDTPWDGDVAPSAIGTLGAGSPDLTTLGVNPGTVLAVSAMPGIPSEVLHPSEDLGLQPFDGMAAISDGGDIFPPFGIEDPAGLADRVVWVQFSFTPGSMGALAPTEVFAVRDRWNDVAAANGGNGNIGGDVFIRVWDHGVPQPIALAIPSPFASPASDLSSLMWGDHTQYPVYFVLEAMTAASPHWQTLMPGICGADILVVTGAGAEPSIAVSHGQLGLGATDMISSLALDSKGAAVFSLQAGSPSLSSIPLDPGAPAYTAADLFCTIQASSSHLAPGNWIPPGIQPGQPFPWMRYGSAGAIVPDGLDGVRIGDPAGHPAATGTPVAGGGMHPSASVAQVRIWPGAGFATALCGDGGNLRRTHYQPGETFVLDYNSATGAGSGTLLGWSLFAHYDVPVDPEVTPVTFGPSTVSMNFQVNPTLPGISGEVVNSGNSPSGFALFNSGAISIPFPYRTTFQALALFDTGGGVWQLRASNALTLEVR